MRTSSLATLPPQAFRSLIGIAGNAFALPCHQRPLLDCPAARDAGQCRIWLNDAQLEIDRLRRGLDRVDLCPGQSSRQILEPLATGDADLGLSVTATPTTYQRRTYAVAAVGDVSMLHPSTTPRTQAHPVISVPLVTNLGSVMDVLL